MQPAPMPPLMYESSNGSVVDASVGGGKPTLVNLWAAWCPPCLDEIVEWSEHRLELVQHVDVLLLSVDRLSEVGSKKFDDANVAEVLQKLSYRGQFGWATSELLDILQQVHNVIYDHHRPLPLPTSFLLDSEGRLCAMYKGPVDSSRILEDLKGISGATSDHRGLPFEGRWMGPLGSHNLQLLVEELYRQGYETESQAYVERLTDDTFKKRHVGARLFLAQELAMRDPNTAFRHAQEVLRLSPNNPKAHERLGLLYARAGKAGEAKLHFQHALKHQTVFEARTHYNFGKLLRSQGATAEAWQQFRLAVEGDARFDLAYEQLGLIRASQRQFADAAKLFATAASIRPQKAAYRVNQAMALTQQNRSAEAWEAIKPIINQSDIPQMALLLGARSLGNLNRFPEAIALLERFLEKEPNAADVRKQLQKMRDSL